MELEIGTEALSDTGAALQAPFPHPPFYLQPMCWGRPLLPVCAGLGLLAYPDFEVILT